MDDNTENQSLKKSTGQDWQMHLAVVLIVIVVWVFSASRLGLKAVNVGSKELNAVSLNTSIERSGICRISELDCNAKYRILNLFDMLENQKVKQRRNFLIYYPYFYISASLLVIAGSLVLVYCLLWMVNRTSIFSLYVKTMFITVLMLGFTHLLSLKAFSINNCITSSMNRYIAYSNLQSEIYDFALIKIDSIASKDSNRINRFHSGVIKSIEELHARDPVADFKLPPILFPVDQHFNCNNNVACHARNEKSRCHWSKHR